MNFLCYLLLVISSFAFCFVKEGQALSRVNMVLLGANGIGAFSKAGTLRLYYRAKPKLRKIGYATHLLSYRYSKAPLPTYRNQGQTDIYKGPLASFYSYWTYLSKSFGGRRHNTAYMVVLPPIQYQGNLWLAGINGKRCGYSDGGLSIVNAKNTLDRQVHSVYAFLHELCHNLGAGHVDTHTVMNYGVLGFVNDQIGFDPESVEEIQACLG